MAKAPQKPKASKTPEPPKDSAAYKAAVLRGEKAG